MEMRGLQAFFEAESIAVIGASKKQGKAGNIILRNLLNGGYGGRIYPVNPSLDEVFDLKAYPSVKDIPEGVDLAVVAVPNRVVVDVVEDCAEKGVKAVLIISGGFSETGEDGENLQERVSIIAREKGIRILGPNTSGIISTPKNIVATFIPFQGILRGGVSYVAQTGNFATHTLKWILSAEHYGVCRIVGLGNKCDLDEADALEYLADDPETKVITLYLEDIRRGRSFLHALKGASKRKPVIILKSGRTQAGLKAAQTHTAAISTQDEIVDAAIKQAGAIRAQEYMELIDYSKAFALQPLPRGDRVGIITISGALGVLASDACERLGLRIAKLRDETLARVKPLYPPWMKISNPLDLWPAAEMSGMTETYRMGMDALLEDDNVDALIVYLMVLREYPVNLDFVPTLCKRHPEKPVLFSCSGEKELCDEFKERLGRMGYPVYLPVEPPCRVLATMYRYKRMRES
jgi:acyl-CoA synthetase (NDP forming)